MILKTFKSDIDIIKERDPAARGILEIFLCYPGFHSIVIHRFTHKLWKLKIIKEVNSGSCVGIVSISPGLLRAAEVIIHSMRGSELMLMTAISDNNSRLLSLLKASSHIVCDGPSLSVVENTLLKNRSQLIRLPQIICAKNYLSIETINQLKKEIGVIN